MLHQVGGMDSTVLQDHLIEGRTLKDLAQAMNCSLSSLRLQLHEGLQQVRQWAQRDGLMPIQTS